MTRTCRRTAHAFLTAGLLSILLSAGCTAAPLSFTVPARPGLAVAAAPRRLAPSRGADSAFLLVPARHDAGLRRPPPPPAQTPVPPTPTPTRRPAWLPPKAVQDLLALINQDRAQQHAPALELSRRQSGCSQAHSLHMAQLGSLSHDQFPADVCIAHRTAGENVGMAWGTPDEVAPQLDRMMMAEGPCPHQRCTATQFQAHGHYLNLVNPAFRWIGIGIVVRDGVTWLTEDFTD